jgi:hypothetical protein
VYSFGIETGYGLDGRGIGVSFFSTSSRPDLGPIQPPIQWVPGVKQPGREADHSPASNAEIKNDGDIHAFLDMPSWHSA